MLSTICDGRLRSRTTLVYDKAITRSDILINVVGVWSRVLILFAKIWRYNNDVKMAAKFYFF